MLSWWINSIFFKIFFLVNFVFRRNVEIIIVLGSFGVFVKFLVYILCFWERNNGYVGYIECYL